MSKESKNKKRFENNNSHRVTSEEPVARIPLTDEQKAKIIRDRLANRPVIIFRYPNGKLNRRFIYTMAFMVVALIAALIFITR